MKISARNVFSGKIKKITTGAVNCEVVIDMGHGIEMTSIITKGSVKRLGLKKGGSAYAIVKASSVLIATD